MVEIDRGFAVIRLPEGDDDAAAAQDSLAAGTPVANMIPVMEDEDGLCRYFLPDELTVQFREDVSQEDAERKILARRDMEIITRQRAAPDAALHHQQAGSERIYFMDPVTGAVRRSIDPVLNDTIGSVSWDGTEIRVANVTTGAGSINRINPYTGAQSSSIPAVHAGEPRHQGDDPRPRSRHAESRGDRVRPGAARPVRREPEREQDLRAEGRAVAP